MSDLSKIQVIIAIFNKKLGQNIQCTCFIFLEREKIKHVYIVYDATNAVPSFN